MPTTAFHLLGGLSTRYGRSGIAVDGKPTPRHGPRAGARTLESEVVVDGRRGWLHGKSTISGRAVTTALALAATVITTAWGTAHLFPTRSVVRGFGEISAENECVITMEWILEGVTLIFVGLLTTAVTLLGDPGSTTAAETYLASAGLLVVMSAVSLLTAGRNEHIAYRLCAPIFTASAILLAAAAAT